MIWNVFCCCTYHVKTMAYKIEPTLRSVLVLTVLSAEKKKPCLNPQLPSNPSAVPPNIHHTGESPKDVPHRRTDERTNPTLSTFTTYWVWHLCRAGTHYQITQKKSPCKLYILTIRHTCKSRRIPKFHIIWLTFGWSISKYILLMFLKSELLT